MKNCQHNFVKFCYLKHENNIFFSIRIITDWRINWNSCSIHHKMYNLQLNDFADITDQEQEGRLSFVPHDDVHLVTTLQYPNWASFLHMLRG